MNKKGVTLIILVITILVMSIIAGIVIISIEENNPITDAKEGAFKGDLAAVLEQAEVEMSDVALVDKKFNRNTFNKTTTEMNTFIPKMPEHLKGYVFIEGGEVKLTMTFKTNFPKQAVWVEELGIVFK